MDCKRPSIYLLIFCSSGIFCDMAANILFLSMSITSKKSISGKAAVFYICGGEENIIGLACRGTFDLDICMAKDLLILLFDMHF